MFKSKTRPIVYTQYEHGRLAGTLARLWGNESFARPSLNFAAYTYGVALHDWAYGLVDNLSIGMVAEEEWLSVIRKGVEKRFSHLTTDIVVKLHLRRLLSSNPSPDRMEIIARIDERVADRLGDSEESLDIYEKGDQITQLCDMIAFDFCFEAPISRTYGVFSHPESAETTNVNYEIKPQGEVRVEP